MSQYNPKIHHRRSIRLEGYDYSQAGLYFITICCQDRAHLFGQVEKGEMILNEFGKIASLEWENTPNVRPNVELGEYIIMPNHIHGILEIKYKISKGEHSNGELSEHSKGELQFAPNTEIGTFKSPSQTIGAMIRGYKIATIKKIKENISNSKSELDEHSKGELQFAPTNKIIQLDYKIWQRNYYEHIIRNEQAYQTISNYIINNPQKWEDDRFFS